MDEIEVRSKKNRNRPNSRKDRLYKLCLQWGDKILERAALVRVLNETEEKELEDLAPSRVLLIRKEKSKKTVHFDGIIFYLKSMYSTHNEESRTFINDIPSKEPSFETITNCFKTFSKCIKDDENMSLKNKCLFGWWILTASKLYRKEI